MSKSHTDYMEEMEARLADLRALLNDGSNPYRAMEACTEIELLAVDLYRELEYEEMEEERVA